MIAADFNAGPAERIGEGATTAVTLAGMPLLLTRADGRIHAVSGTCPHATGPLAEGIFTGGRVVCPWHKAAFCLRSGAVAEPPAVDDLPRFPARIVGGDVIVTLPEPPPRFAPASPAPPRGDARTFAVIGAGAAGVEAARVLRAEGFGGRVLLISPEKDLPYDRTVLSKYRLSGQAGAEKSPLHEDGFYESQHIERIHAAVTAIDAGSRRLLLSDGTTVSYDEALAAPGASPRRPDFDGAGLAGIFTLRSAADATKIHDAALAAGRAIVAGASFIGLEVAASLRERGIDVTVVMPDAVPFARIFGEEIGRRFLALHRERGVAFRPGRRIAAALGEHAVAAVRLDDGTVLPADLVVVGTGVSPATGWMGDLAREEDGGVPVDAFLRAAPGLFAAGDAAAFPDPAGADPAGEGRLRIEHWRLAQQQGRVAALNMLGRAASFSAVPYFWTIQYRQRLDYVGHAGQCDRIVLRGDLEKPDFIAYYIRQGRVRAAAGWNRDREMAALIVLLARRSWTVDELHPPAGSPLQRLESSPSAAFQARGTAFSQDRS